MQLHGLGSSRAREDATGANPTAGAAGLRVLRIDAPGHGESAGSDSAADYTWSSLAPMVAEVLARVFPGRAVHGVGTSMGAGTLLHAAVGSVFPLASLSLVIPPTAWRTRIPQAVGYEDAADFVERQGFSAFAHLVVQQGPPPGADPRQPVLVPDLVPETAAAVYRGAASADLPAPAALRDIALPSQILARAGDPSHPVSTAEALRELLSARSFDIAENPSQDAAWPSRVAEFIRSVS